MDKLFVKLNTIVALVIFFGLFIIFFLLVGPYRNSVFLEKNYDEWVISEAELISGEINQFPYDPESSTRLATYGVTREFSYLVLGDIFESTCYNMIKAPISTVTPNYKEGTKFKIKYNPNNPNEVSCSISFDGLRLVKTGN